MTNVRIVFYVTAAQSLVTLHDGVLQLFVQEPREVYKRHRFGF